MTRKKTPERGQPCPRVESEVSLPSDKAVHAPDAIAGLRQTEIGTIANDWMVTTLENVCEPPQYGFTASAEEKGNARFLRITDVTDSGVNWPNVPFCDCPEELLDKYRLASGDIVFARIGATTGKSYLITNPPHSVFASYLIRVRCKSDIDPDFLSKFFRSDAYWWQVDAQKDTNLKSASMGRCLRHFKFPLHLCPSSARSRRCWGWCSGRWSSRSGCWRWPPN